MNTNKIKDIHKSLRNVSTTSVSHQQDNDLDLCFDSMDFRIWSRQILKEFIIKGFVMDDERLKGNEPYGEEYFSDLQDRIREIRLSERCNYQKITDIFAEFSYDYDKESIIAKNFYQAIINIMREKKENLLNMLEVDFIHTAQITTGRHQLMRMTNWKNLYASWERFY